MRSSIRPTWTKGKDIGFWEIVGEDFTCSLQSQCAANSEQSDSSESSDEGKPGNTADGTLNGVRML